MKLRILFANSLIGFMSGMTVLLSSGTLNFWLARAGVDKTAIGLFALVSLPYAINFIWSPLLDNIRLPIISSYFPHRFSWVIVIQIALSCAVFFLSKCSITDLWQVAVCALLIAFLSSTQDVALGTIRIAITPKNLQGFVAGGYIFGYRIGMLSASSGAIYASIYFSWQQIYACFATVILYFPVLLYLTIHYMPLVSSPNSNIKNHFSVKFWRTALAGSGGLKVITTIVIFLILYRLPDNFITVMINPFLLEIQFDEFAIATIGKTLGIFTAIIGGFFASYLMKKVSVIDSLLYFGILHAFAHLLFLLQNHMGNDLSTLFLVVGFESLTGGMVMACYIAFITSLCSGTYSATQYSFFSSMMGLSRSIFPSISGIMVYQYGWNNFFILISLMTIPALLLAIKLKVMLLTLKEDR